MKGTIKQYLVNLNDSKGEKRKRDKSDEEKDGVGLGNPHGPKKSKRGKIQNFGGIHQVEWTKGDINFLQIRDQR